MEPTSADPVGLKMARWSSTQTQNIQAREKSSATFATQKLSDRLRRLQGGLSEPGYEKFSGHLNRFGFDANVPAGKLKLGCLREQNTMSQAAKISIIVSIKAAK